MYSSSNTVVKYSPTPCFFKKADSSRFSLSLFVLLVSKLQQNRQTSQLRGKGIVIIQFPFINRWLTTFLDAPLGRDSLHYSLGV